MRRLSLAALVALGLAAPAMAQPADAPPLKLPPAEAPATQAGLPPPSELTGSNTLPPLIEEGVPTSTVAADLSNLYVAIAQAEVTMTGLRDRELIQENAKLRAVKPALWFGDHGWFPPLHR